MQKPLPSSSGRSVATPRSTLLREVGLSHSPAPSCNAKASEHPRICTYARGSFPDAHGHDIMHSTLQSRVGHAEAPALKDAERGVVAARQLLAISRRWQKRLPARRIGRFSPQTLTVCPLESLRWPRLFFPVGLEVSTAGLCPVPTSRPCAH